MKRYRFVIGVVVFVATIIIALGSYIVTNKDKLVYRYMLYDHIQYNGIDYYQSKDQLYLPSKTGENRGPVYLVYKSRKINYEKCNTAYVHTGYEGEEDEVYIFFDSALYIRGDYLNS